MIHKDMYLEMDYRHNKGWSELNTWPVQDYWALTFPHCLLGRVVCVSENMEKRRFVREMQGRVKGKTRDRATCV